MITIFLERIKEHWIKCKAMLVFALSMSFSGLAHSQDVTSIITNLLLEPCPIVTMPPLKRCTSPVLQTQKDVDAFKSVEVVLGHLQIEAETDLDLSPFDKLREIQGILYLHNGNLSSINGFNNLESVGSRAASFGFGRQIYIDNNPQLTTVSGFQKLRKSGHPEARSPSIFIRFNPLLGTVSGFNALDEAGTVSIRYNAQLSQVTGFDSLQTIDSGLYITNSPGLTSLPSFANLTTIGSLDLYDLPALNSMPGFQSLTYSRTLRVHNLGISELRSFNNSNFHTIQSLSITENRNLLLMAGFSSLRFIEGERGDMYINDNPVLNDVTGFNQLVTNDPTDYISVADNTSLDCPAELFMLEPVAYSQSNNNNCETTPYDFNN